MKSLVPPAAAATLALLPALAGCSSNDPVILLRPPSYAEDSRLRHLAYQNARVLRSRRIDPDQLELEAVAEVGNTIVMLENGSVLPERHVPAGWVLSAGNAIYFWESGKPLPVPAGNVPALVGCRIRVSGSKGKTIRVPKALSLGQVLNALSLVLFGGIILFIFRRPDKPSARERWNALAGTPILKSEIILWRLVAVFSPRSEKQYQDRIDWHMRAAEASRKAAKPSAVSPEEKRRKEEKARLAKKKADLEKERKELELLRKKRREAEEAERLIAQQASDLAKEEALLKRRIAEEKEALEELAKPPSERKPKPAPPVSPPPAPVVHVVSPDGVIRVVPQATHQKQTSARQALPPPSPIHDTATNRQEKKNETEESANKPHSAGPFEDPKPGSRSVVIGKRLPDPGSFSPTEIFHDDEPPVVHAFKGEIKKFVVDNVPGVSFEEPGEASGEVRADAKSLSRHSFVVGVTGTGKTRLLVRMAIEQLKSGCSVIMMDPKEETLAHAYELALEAGFPKEQVDLLLPRHGENARCRFNPLMGSPTGFASVLEGIVQGWGPRMGDLLVNCLVIVQRMEASPLELVKFLQDEAYRQRCLSEMERRPKKDLELKASLDYFRSEFDPLSANEKNNRVGPVLNKLRDFVRNPFFHYAMCGWLPGDGGPMFDAANYFSLDLPPRLGLVHMDRDELGDSSVKLFAGMAVNHVFFRSMSNNEHTSRPCVLCMDEMAVSARFVGDVIKDILAISRAKNLRLLIAFQDFSQIDPSLKATLTANAAVQCYFRLGPDDAKSCASAFSVSAKERVTKVTVGRSSRPYKGTRLKFEITERNGNLVKWFYSGNFTDNRSDLRARETETGTSYPLDHLKKYYPWLNASKAVIVGGDNYLPGRSSYVEVDVPGLDVKSVDRTGPRDSAKEWAEQLASVPNGQCVVRMPSQGVFKAQVAHVPDQRDPKAFDKFPPFRGSVTPEEAAEAREREINGAKPEEKGNGNEDDRKVREDKYGDIGDDPGL